MAYGGEGGTLICELALVLQGMIMLNEAGERMIAQQSLKLQELWNRGIASQNHNLIL